MVNTHEPLVEHQPIHPWFGGVRPLKGASPGAFENFDLSTDWEKYSTAEETRDRRRKPEDNAVGALVVRSVRAIPGQTVVHAPDPTGDPKRKPPLPPNRAHTHISGHKTIDAVYAANDEMALGAIKAIQGAGRKGILVVGNDGEAPAIQAVLKGELAATVGIPAFKQGFIGVEAAAKYLQGKHVCKIAHERATLITRSNAAKANVLFSDVSPSARYWESCFK